MKHARQQYTYSLLAPFQRHVPTVPPRAFRSVAVSPVLFQTYQRRPQYRLTAVLRPLPV